MGFNIIEIISGFCNKVVSLFSEHIIEVGIGLLVIGLIIGYLIFVKGTGGI